MKSTWPPQTYVSTFATVLPERPGILKPTVCPRCGVIHASLTEKRQCQQLAWREQA